MDRAEDQAARYDRIADGYARWWAPVIAPAALDLLDRLAGPLAVATDVVDIGTGTLALAAVGRWPHLRIVGVDASAEMAARAAAEADAQLADEARQRVQTIVAPADRTTLGAASADVVVSSFVYQLVPNRHRALVEARRLLRPGGTIGYVTWLRGGPASAADAAVDEVLERFGFDPREPDPDPGDLASPEAAAAGLRRAGFRAAHAEAGLLDHRWGPAEIVGFLEHFDETSTFEALEPDQRPELRDALLERLTSLSVDELALRLPIVYATALTG